MSGVILLTSLTGAPLERVKRALGDPARLTIVADLQGLLGAPIDGETSLISFGTSVIVPEALLRRLNRPAYNVHAASPEFPGRDPHHFAIFRCATTYGATLHLMTAQVDAGPIVGVELFPVNAARTPHSLLREANEAALQLVERFGRRLLDREALPALPGVEWGAVKTRRADLHSLCELSPLVSAEEFERRMRAFDAPHHANLTVRLHGHLFRIDQHSGHREPGDSNFSQFTETGLLALVRDLTKAGYRFPRLGDDAGGRHVLWRHDVDVSMHRAARIAELENGEGVVATYFVNPRSAFYSLFEPEVEALLRRVGELGHEIGLHFDAGAYGVMTWTDAALDAALRRERSLLETLLGSPVRVVSWHNPDQSNLLSFGAETLAGLVSAYSDRLRRDYTYCSDSNGYWRFKPMHELIREGHERLHLLTHPEWWTPEAMSPSDRIERAILGRARKIRRNYDERIARAGRINLKA
jgi:formyl transferase-like protein